MSHEVRTRLIRRLGWQKAVNDAVIEPRNRLALLPTLRRWQSTRLRAGFQDFLAEPSMRPAAEFFLTDLYGDKDFSARDRDAARLLPAMARFLPESLLRAAADAIELAVLSHAFDLRMAEVLMQRPDPRAAITDEAYAHAYRATGQPRLRRHQIGLILRVGHALDAAVNKHGVAKLLRAARLPTLNVPKPTRLTVSPFFNAFVMDSIVESSARAAAAFEMSADFAIASTKSDLFTYVPFASDLKNRKSPAAALYQGSAALVKRIIKYFYSCIA